MSNSRLDSPGLGAVLGPRLRERRNDLGKTLATLAREADLSTGYLSSIETGASIPSLPVLARLSRSLEVPLAEILRTSSSVHLARGHIIDPDAPSELAGDASQMQIVRQYSEPGDTGSAPVELGNGDVFVYLYLGQLEVTLADGEFKLGPGDALHCDRPTTLTWCVPNTDRAVALWATVRARTKATPGHHTTD